MAVIWFDLHGRTTHGCVWARLATAQHDGRMAAEHAEELEMVESKSCTQLGRCCTAIDQQADSSRVRQLNPALSRAVVPATLCFQSMAKMSSSVHGLAWSVPSVHLSTATSRRVGVGCGCHRASLKSTCACCLVLQALR
jgi:hypothetical protein